MQILLQGHNDCFLKVEQTLEAIQLLLRQQVESPKSHSNRHDGVNSTEAAYQPVSSILQHPRIMKVDFPKFSGDEAMQWIYKAERFFRIYSIPDDQKVPMALLQFEGKALS